MTARIVDDLESVQIDETERMLRAAALGLRVKRAQVALEFSAVRQARQRVVPRLIRESRCQAARLRDVTDVNTHTDEAVRMTDLLTKMEAERQEREAEESP